MPAGKIVILIGGLGLIGRGVAAGLARAGARVVVASRGAGRANALDDFAALDEAARGRLEAMAADINDAASLEALLSGTAARHGHVDAVVNCAYPQQDGFGTRFENVRHDVFCANVSRHLGGFFLVAQKACALFTAQGGGTLVQFSSVYGLMNPRFELYEGTPMTKEVDYVVTKAAIIQLTGYLAQYHKGKGIRVNCVSPGGVFDRQHPAFLARYQARCAGKGMLDPDDIAGTVAFLVSDASAHITGQNLVVDDGFSL